MGKEINNDNVNAVPLTSTQIDITKNNEPTFSSGELGQLQEILFGHQQRSTQQQIHALQTEVEHRLENLDSLIEKRFGQLEAQFNTSAKEQQAHVDSLRSGAEELKEGQHSHTELLASIEKSLSELRQQKLDSDKLAELLGNMAGLLSSQQSR